jgi:di/tricarboxylate transporter
MLSLTPQEYYLIAVVAAALLLILSGRLRSDVVALLVLLALGLSGLVTPDEALAGFSRPAVITIVGLFIMTAALERTGVVQWISERLAGLSGRTEPRIVAVFMLAGALLSLVMNNIAAGAVLLPAAVHVTRQTNVRPSKVLIPLAFGTLLGGMATLFTTANIIMSAALQSAGGRPLTMGDFLLTGGAMVLSGTTFMLLLGRRLLPNRESLTRITAQHATDLRATYQLDERLWEVQIAAGSPLVGQTLVDSRIGERLGVTVLAIWHGGEARISPTPQEMLYEGDILLILGREARVRHLEAERAYIGRDGNTAAQLPRQAVQLTEVIIAPRSPVISQTLRDIRFRDKYGLTTVAIWRNGRSYRTDVGHMPLQAGDALLMVGPTPRVQLLAREPGYILLEEPAPITVRRWRGPISAGIAALAIGLSASGLVSTPEAMLAGAVALVLTGCISMEEAYRSVEWRIVFLIAGMLPISTAMLKTGLATEIGQVFVTTLTPFGALALVAGMYLFTAGLTQVMGGQVTALIVGPIAIATAAQAGVNQTAMAVAVAMACSAAFLTPIAHPVNLLMISPGGYTARDFVSVGAGMLAVCFLTLLVVMPLFWGI